MPGDAGGAHGSGELRCDHAGWKADSVGVFRQYRSRLGCRIQTGSDKARGPHERILTVVALRDNVRALSGGFDDTLRLWDLASGKCLKTIECGTEDADDVFSSAVNPAGTQALSGHRGGRDSALEPRNGRMPGDAEGPFGHRGICPDHAGRTVWRFGFGRQDRQGLGPGSGNLRRDVGGPSVSCLRSPSPRRQLDRLRGVHRPHGSALGLEVGDVPAGDLNAEGIGSQFPLPSAPMVRGSWWAQPTTRRSTSTA